MKNEVEECKTKKKKENTEKKQRNAKLNKEK